MKIALVTAYFYPISSGGTEKYVLSLAKSLIKKEHEVHIITTGTKNQMITYEDLIVHYVNDELSKDLKVLSSKKASDNLDDFTRILAENNYDLAHFHTLTPAFSIFHISAAKSLNLKIHFTAHVPSMTCIHGDLMQYGKYACDGLIQKQRCTACYISKKGLNKPISNIIAKTVNILNYPFSTATVVDTKIENLLELNNLCDKIFLFTNWQKEIFILNGFNPEKISITSQLLDKEIFPQTSVRKEIKNIGFVGRISHEKGLHILIEAFKLANRKDLQLHIAGILNDKKYFKKLKSKTERDTNVQWYLNLSKSEISEFYQTIDILIIPSITYETGPFVLFEAFENNIPVIAHNLGDMEIWKNKGFKIKIYDSTLNLKNCIQILS
ncbi:glycosyltransferase [Pedobacter agri]|uniref:glycosyltransferase n=1 Tax=Pedobacter agri TaxID=454586 RepID=UPI00292D3904|nr:glycosyltransferase [Pedobacter agri]